MRIVFENATIRDSITKASRVAPTRGSAFDKANGLLFSVVAGVVSIRATNLEIFYHEVIDAVEVEGEGEWRLSSAILAGFASKLSVTSGRTITFEDDGTTVIAKSGRTTAKFRMLPAEYFPPWNVFATDSLTTVNSFAERVQQVAWAADDKSVPMTGIHLTGEKIMATNRYRIASAPCKIPDLEEPITVPSNIFDPIMKNLGDVKLGIDGGHLLLMPDDYTQIKAVIFGDKYPDLETAIRKFSFTDEVKFSKTTMVEMIDLTQVFAGSNRMPKMTMIIGKQELGVMLDENQHMVGDVIELPGQCEHRRERIDFLPRSILEAVSASPSEEVIMHYNAGQATTTPVLIDGGSGYQAWVMPRRELSKSE